LVFLVDALLRVSKTIAHAHPDAIVTLSSWEASGDSRAVRERTSPVTQLRTARKRSL
jgi:hypothetical protein